MAFVLGDRPIQPLTAHQAMQMLEAGIIPEDNRLELLHGMLTEEDLEYLHEHPFGAFLVIEVARTSLKIDTQIKPPLYAGAGVPDCWVVDVVARRVRVYRDPTPDGYETITTHGPTGKLQPLAVDVEPLDLAALFDGLR